MRRLRSIVWATGLAALILLFAGGATVYMIAASVFAPAPSAAVRDRPLVGNERDCTIDWSQSRGSCASGSADKKSAGSGQSASNREACGQMNTSYPDHQVARCAQERNIYRPVVGSVGSNLAQAPSSQAPSAAPALSAPGSSGGPPQRVSTTYYVEFIKNGTRFEPDQAQTVALRQALSTATPKRIIYFVHGFRNSADVRTADPGRFATMMAYMTAFVATRCDKEGESRYGVRCLEPRDTIGVYLAWPAADLDERRPWGAQLALLTFPRMKQRSDMVGHDIVQYIETMTRLARTRVGEDRVQALAVGHSLGGNVLLTGLLGANSRDLDPASPIARALAGWSTPKGQVPSESHQLVLPGADLFVLMNPAAEAEKWIRLQLHEFRLRKTAGFFSKPPDVVLKPGGRLNTHYSIAQLPRVISMQVPCEGLGDPTEGRVSADRLKKAVAARAGPASEGIASSQGLDSPCDIATFSAFRLSQAFVNRTRTGHVPLNAITSLGHYQSQWDDGTGNSKLLGLSHVITNRNTGSFNEPTSVSTLLLRAGKDECRLLQPGWLRDVRRAHASLDENGQGPRPWDTAGTAVVRSWTSGQDPQTRVEAVQSLYGVYMPPEFLEILPWEGNAQPELTTYRTALARLIGGGQDEPPVPPNPQLVHQLLISDRYTPFWNAVLSASMGDGHGGFYSRLLFCHMTQLWLDAPSARLLPAGGQ
jgi:hypothetical protein